MQSSSLHASHSTQVYYRTAKAELDTIMAIVGVKMECSTF